MNSEITPVNRNTGKLITKNIIILVVLLAVCSLSIWAWFTQTEEANANGISVRSRADGVQVSWDGEDFYNNLTALTDAEVVENKTGKAKNISGTDGEPLKLNLITGNGIDFFEPYLNRRTGTVITDSATGVWNGITVDSSNSEGKYVDLHLYFRGTSQRDVYLAGDSLVSPKSDDNTVRTSEYGAFTRDYIAAASRLAFINVTEETDSEGNVTEKHDCSFIWAPNADIELKENEDGYIKYTTTDTEEVTSSGGTDGVLDGGAVDDGMTYYLWTFKDELIDTDAKSRDSSYLEPREFEYDADIKYFVTTVNFYIPTYQTHNPSIPVIINNSKDAITSDDSVNIAGYDSLVNGQKQTDQHFFVTNGDWNLDNNTIKCTNKMYADSAFITSGEHITVKFGYNPKTNLLTVLSYNTSGGGKFTLGGEEEEVPVILTYFPLENNTNCALVNPTGSVAVSTGDHRMKAVQFGANSNVLPVSITGTEQFTAILSSGSDATATYKFQNVKYGTYLNVSGNDVTFGKSGSNFTLHYTEGADNGTPGAVLKCGDYFLVYKNGSIAAVKEAEFDYANAVLVYTGTSYQLNKELSNDSQSYQYYNAIDDSANGVTPGLKALGLSSTPPLFTSSCYTDAAVRIGDTKIATLAADSDYYTAHIIIRIWVEGTDREAKTPLADGIFDMSLHFVSY